MKSKADLVLVKSVMPYFSKYSDEQRFSLDVTFLKGCESTCSDFDLSSNKYLISGYQRNEQMRFDLGPLKVGFPISYRMLRFVCDSAYWVSESGEADCVQRIRSEVESRKVDRIHFHYFRPSTPESFESFSRGFLKFGFRKISHGSTRLYRCFVGSGSELPSMRLKAKNRYKERKKLKSLGEQFGETRFVRYTEPDQEAAFFSAIRNLSGATWQRQQGLGTVIDSEQFREIFRLESNRGRMRCYVLFAGETPVAYQFGTLYDDVYHYEYIGYNVDFQKFSPGQLLRLHSFDEMHAEPEINWVDFGHVEFDFKQQWSTECIDLPDVSFYRKSFKGTLAYFVERIRSGLKRRLKR